MSVQETIDTTVTLQWGDHRTIGTLVELNGYSAVLTALRAPEAGTAVAFRVEGETEEEAVTIDGVCIAVGDTGWGERRCEIDLVRVGTTCSASRLRDFIEGWAIARGGSVHIGQSPPGAQPTGGKRFVYHLPDRSVASRRSNASITSSTPRDIVGRNPDAPIDLPDAVVMRRAHTATAPDAVAKVDRNLGARRPARETVPATGEAANQVVGEISFGDEEEFSVHTNPERTLNTEIAAGLLSGSGLDAAFRDALRAVESPRVPRSVKATVAQPMRLTGAGSASPPRSLFSGDAGDDQGFDREHADVRSAIRPAPPALPPRVGIQDDDEGEEDDELEPTRAMAAMDDEPMRFAFETGELSIEETQELMAKVDGAIALEKALSQGAEFDFDEPIVVNTVPLDVPFADPVQLGHDNKAPSMASVLSAPTPSAPAWQPRAAPEEPQPEVGTSTGRSRKMTVAESLALPLRAPAPLVQAPLGYEEDEDDPTLASGEDIEAAVQRPISREISPALKRVAEIFAVDIAVRTEISCNIVMGRKKTDGRVIRLAESKLRLQCQQEPEMYQRIQVALMPADGGKKPFSLQCEVMRIRDRAEEGAPCAFDVRVSPGNSPKDMTSLRAVIVAAQAPAART